MKRKVVLLARLAWALLELRMERGTLRETRRFVGVLRRDLAEAKAAREWCENRVADQEKRVWRLRSEVRFSKPAEVRQ